MFRLIRMSLTPLPRNGRDGATLTESKAMPWIETVPYEASTGKLRQLYDRVKGPGDNVDNIMMMHSLRPHTMEAHMAVYKHTLHHSANTVPKWFLETLGVWVSTLNACGYCVAHHFAGLQRLLGDAPRGAAPAIWSRPTSPPCGMPAGAMVKFSRSIRLPRIFPMRIGRFWG